MANLRIPNYFKQVKSYSTMTISKPVNQADFVKRNLMGLSSQNGQLYTTGPTVILGPIFQSSNQGGSTVPWPYYPTTYKHVLVSV